MMAIEWEPGDVALVDSWRGNGQIAVRCERIEGQPTWCVLDGTDTRGLTDEEIVRARPATILDPDSPNGTSGRRSNLYRVVAALWLVNVGLSLLHHQIDGAISASGAALLAGQLAALLRRRES